jgi:hypothetical protein
MRLKDCCRMFDLECDTGNSIISWPVLTAFSGQGESLEVQLARTNVELFQISQTSEHSICRSNVGSRKMYL